MKPAKPGPAPATSGPASAKAAHGQGLIKSIARNLPSTPGVYRMLGAGADGGQGRVLYVGKAKNLKKRVASYAVDRGQGARIRRMVEETREMEFVTTHTESEALLLEANLIKQLKPKYNILLRDDKSFPEIAIDMAHDFPRVVKHRGRRAKGSEYFGPFASVWAVNETIAMLQRAFLLRTCADAVFSSRTRPCLLYQIKRCSAPCTGEITNDDYRTLLDEARDFLAGKSTHIQKKLAREMQAASDAREFELAATLRDRIRALTRIQERQDINPAAVADADVISVATSDKNSGAGRSCVQVFFYRGGRNFGNRAYYPAQSSGASAADIVLAFIGQFYAAHTPPGEIIIDCKIPADAGAELETALSERAGKRVVIKTPARGPRAELARMAHKNALDALALSNSQTMNQEKLLAALGKVIGMDGPPGRVEIYDNSHVSGTNAVGAMVVAGAGGFERGQYRKFNIRGEMAPGDDYAMMAEVLRRRFARALKGDDKWPMPDLLVIDGGLGQLGAVTTALADLGVGEVFVVAVSKGPDRNAGREQIHIPGRKGALILESSDPVLHFIQRLRDEAHRFAIGTHRKKRNRATLSSSLDDVPGIGGVRKKALLHHFGSAAAVRDAGLRDLEKVSGISKAIAKQVYDWFHPDG